MKIKGLTAFIVAVVSLLFPAAASAHSFGISYTLPLPLWIFAYGAGAAVIASFLVISYLVGNNNARKEHGEMRLSWLEFATRKWFVALAKAFAVFLFLLAIVSGLVGDSNSYFNINMALFWIIFVLGFTYLVALIGDIYSAINPAKTIVELSERLGLKSEPMAKYPKWLGYWPALIFYFVFIWIELFGMTDPRGLSFLLLQYLFMTVAGVVLWGKEIWFKYCDVFSVFFGIIGKASVLHARDNKIYLRPPFAGVLKEKAESMGQILFILFMLSSTAFDGFHSTRAYYDLHSLVKFIPFPVFQNLAFLTTPFIFLGVYFLFIWLTKLMANSKESVKNLALYFAFSLVPIALVYNIAHYYTLLINEGQGFIRLISDPFGFGWDLFGTAGFQTSLAFTDTVLTWYVQLGLILIGHIAGVYLAHVQALKIFTEGKRAVLSQLPLLLLMVIYTMAGLWILYQPIGGSAF